MPLLELSKEIISVVDPKRLLQLIVNIAVKETRADKALIALIEDATGRLSLRQCHGLSPNFVIDFDDQYSEYIAKIMLNDKNPFVITSEAQMPHEFEEIKNVEQMSSCICMPLTIRGKIIGLICIMRVSDEYPFTAADVEFISVLSGQAAAAIENARLYEKLEESYLSTIVTLSGVVEAKDLYTDKHMKDIAEYSVEIAKKLRLSEHDIENIRKAALLHDLGKVSVPDSILMKAGKLSEEEMEIIRKHPAAGAKMIESVEPLKQAQEIIKYHQECFDGSGYPDGLKGEDIPLGARIVAVADAFGAMTTDRPYRNALSTEEAVSELKRFAGKQFDLHIVEIFISVLKDKGVLKDV